MKKLFRNALMLAGMGSALFFTSCDDTVEEPTSTADPTINLSVEESMDIYPIDAAVNFVVAFEADAGIVGGTIDISTEQYDLDLDITNGGVSSNVIDLNFFEVASATEGSFTISGFRIPEQFEASIMTVIISLEDADGNNFNDEVELEVASNLSSFTAKLLGGQYNTSTGSFFDAHEGVVRTTSQAFETENTDKNDLVFWYGNSSQYAIGAVDDDAAQTAFSEVDVTLNNLNPKSLSRFKQFVGDIDFDNISNSIELENAYETDGTANLTSVKDLAPEDVFGIVLDSDRGARIGLVKVISISGETGAERAITIDVKIQSEDN